MSDTPKDNELPSMKYGIHIDTRESLVLVTLVTLLVADLGLIYVLYRQAGGVASRTILDFIITLGILFVIAIISVTLIRVSVSRYKKPAETIPYDDRKLLEELVRDEKDKAIELYVRLSSLGGPTGTATKLGLTGLPLATIGLTLFFALVALYEPTFLDLAKLTLGAFIGSFVQRSGEALERAVRATAGSTPPSEGAKPGT